MDNMSSKFGLPQSLLDAVRNIQKEETEYQAKVKALMKKKGITSISQLSPDEKKAFFNQLDAMHQAKHEEVKPDVAKSFPASGVKKHVAPKGVSTMPKDKEKAKGQPAGSLKKEEIELDEGKVKELMMDINDVASKMRKNKTLEPFAGKFVTAAKKSLNIKKSLEDVLPDYISGAEIAKLYKEEIELDEAIPKSTGYALVHSPSKKIVAKGNKEEMMKKMKDANAKEKGSHHLGMTIRGKVGDKFGEEVEKKTQPPFTPDKPKKNPGVIPGKGGTGPSRAAHLAKMALRKQLKKEEIELDESKSSTGYELYHKDFSSAMAHAYDFAKKKYNIEIDPLEIDRNVAMGPRKPASGKANAYRLLDKTGKKAIQVQVANLDNKRYELNMYKEDIDEACWDTHKQEGMKKKGDKMVPNCVPKNEASSPAQQAAIAISMKKAGKTPKEEGVMIPGKMKSQARKVVGSIMSEEEIAEAFSSAQIDKLRQEYSKINKVDPSSDTYKKLIAMLDKLDLKTLQSLAGAKIKFVSPLAQNRVVRKMNEEKTIGAKKEATGNEKPVKKGEKVSGKQEPITIDPEVDEKK